MPWNYLQLELAADDGLVFPTVGPGGLTREQASAEILTVLGPIATVRPEVAQKWREGPKDDTLFLGPFTWAIYSYTGDDPNLAAAAWIQDYVQILRTAGLDAQIGRKAPYR